MNPIIYVAVVISSVTSYQPKVSQTDDTPFYTSINERVNGHGVAVSRDLLCPMSLNKNLKIKRHLSNTCNLRHRYIHYYDALYIEGFGFKIVNDCMNQRHKRALDIFVWTQKEERAIGVRTNLKVWRIYNGKAKR